VRAEDGIDSRRYIAAIRRDLALIAGFVAVVVVLVVGVSLLLPKSYEASTSIVIASSVAGFTDADSDAVRRQLATTDALLTAPRVLEAAAVQVPGESGDSLEGKVESRVDPEASNANIIEITAADGDPDTAAAIANAVSEGFLAERAAFERERIQTARSQLEGQLDTLASDPNAEEEFDRVRQRLSQLTLAEASAGSDLQVLAVAEPPSSPSSPKPIQNGLLAGFAALFLGVMLSLGRDQLSPRVDGPRELGQLLGTRVLAGVPHVRQHGTARRRRLLTGAEAEAYDSLRANVELLAPPSEKPALLITSAETGEGKTTVTWRLGNALARGGRKVLLISADLRVPRLHELAGIDLDRGLSDLLTRIDSQGKVDASVLKGSIREVATGVGSQSRGCLHVMGSGSRTRDPGRLISGGSMDLLLQVVREMDYDYCLIDAPPLIGLVDSHMLWRYVDHGLLVSRIGQITVDHVAELRETLDTFAAEPLGVVAIGARAEPSPYYLSERPPLVAGDESAQVLR
jgi:Mrp family chromosome partitioning ATPase/capsular polysaccharide biosynthesis protein